MTQPAPLAPNETQRMRALHSFNVLDTEPEQAFDDLTQIASTLSGCSMALVSLVDDSRQWFKSRRGLDAEETPREISFCGHAILSPNTVMQVPDATKDERFKNNPLVTGEPHIVFYAGAPLVTKGGMAIGTLCVLDREPKMLGPEQLAALQALARQVVAQLALSLSEVELQRSNEYLSNFTNIAAHDLRAPLRNIRQLLGFIEEDSEGLLPNGCVENLQVVQHRAQRMDAMVSDLLAYASVESLQQERQGLDTMAIIEATAELVLPSDKFVVEMPDNLPSLFAAPAIADLVFRNILSNVVKHHDRDNGVISIGSSITNDGVSISITDDGPGIPLDQQDKIFHLFGTVKSRDASDSSGMGLALVKKAMETAGGKVSVQSGEKRGTTFLLEWPKFESATDLTLA